MYEDVQAEVGNWKNIKEIATFREVVLGLREDGTVLYTGYPKDLWWWLYEDDELLIIMEQINDWTDIKSLGRGEIPCAIRNDGTVISIYDKTNDDTENWSDITAYTVTYYGWTCLGLKDDGTMIGGWYENNKDDSWTDIVDFDAIDVDVCDTPNSFFLLGLKNDGTIVTDNYEVERWYVLKWNEFTVDDIIEYDCGCAKGCYCFDDGCSSIYGCSIFDDYCDNEECEYCIST